MLSQISNIESAVVSKKNINPLIDRPTILNMQAGLPNSNTRIYIIGMSKAGKRETEGWREADGRTKHKTTSKLHP